MSESALQDFEGDMFDKAARSPGTMERLSRLQGYGALYEDWKTLLDHHLSVFMRSISGMCQS